MSPIPFLFIGALAFCALAASSVPTSRRRPLEPLLTITEHGPWIVTLRDTHSHDDFNKHFTDHIKTPAFSNSSRSHVVPQITHRYDRVMHGVVVRGAPAEALSAFPSVLRVVPDGVMQLMDDLSWGQDRVDQKDLPLDDRYAPAFDGSGVDVYILDTGLDTNHDEFKNRAAPVKTVYDAYARNKEHPDNDNDMQGHGTHVAGTIGGNTFGIARGASLLSVRILNDVGQGTVSDIIAALEFIMRHKKPNHPTVMSMSLGGPCQPSDCAQDPLVMAVQTLAKAGVIISVAAGNSACNACSGSPNSAPDAITTGASTIEDGIAFFSNFGQCVDIFAPGHEIISACAKVVCGDEHQYWQLSGTSMACPHVTGVIAQLLQRFPTANYQLITKYLSCDAAKNRIHLDSRDTLSRNLLLQVPGLATEYTDEYCQLSSDECPDSCSEHGICMPLHPHIGAEVESGDSGSLIETPMTCQCDYGWYGASCRSETDPMCPGPEGHNVKLQLFDAVGDGWSFATYTISDLATGAVVVGAMDSMCFGSEIHHSYCLADGCYKFETSKGQFPGENEWKMCGISGGTPFSGEFCIRAGHCLFQCPEGNFVDITMEDQLGQGWNGAYYEVYTPDGKQTFGGGLLSGEAAVHTLCLPRGCSYIMLESTTTTSTSGDIRYDICGSQGSTKTVTEVCIHEDGSCSTPDPLRDSSCPETKTASAMYLFDRGGDGWGGSSYAIKTAGGNSVATGTLESGFADSHPVCLADGCYDFTVSSGSHDKEIFWNLCGHRGVAPFESQLCVEKEYDFCYGLSGCPPLKSYLHHSDAQYYFVYHAREGGGYDLDAAGDLHGVHELCGLSQTEGCHRLAVGSGKHFLPDEDEHYDLCGNKGTVPASGDVCMVRNTDGTVSCNPNMKSVSCAANEKPQLFAMADQAGDGWGDYFFEIRDTRGNKLYKDTLSAGSFDTRDMCFKEGCYDFSFGTRGRFDQDVNEIVWVFCGVVGPAVESVQFCVTEFGCDFIIPEDNGGGYYEYYYAGGYYGGGSTDDHDDVVDDDFPVDFETTRRPTASPTKRVIGLPTISQRPTTNPTPEPTSPHVPYPTLAPSMAPTKVPSLAPNTGAPSVSPTHPFGMLTVKINITTEIASDFAKSEALLSFDYSFVGDAVGRVLGKSGDGVITHNVAARVVAVRPFFDPSDDGSHRNLLDSSKGNISLKQTVESVLALRNLRSAAVRAGSSQAMKRSVIVQVGDSITAQEERMLFLMPMYSTVQVAVAVSNADIMSERTAWGLKEAVDTTILLANVDGTLQRKLSRAYAEQLDGSKSKYSAFRIVGVGVDSKTVPKFDKTQYEEKPATIDFDDDDLFDDVYDGMPPTDTSNVDTAAIVARTNVFVGVLTALITFTIVIIGALMCIYRESGNKLKYTLQSIVSRDSFSPRRSRILKNRGGQKSRMDRKEVSSSHSNESVTVVFNPVYSADEEL